MRIILKETKNEGLGYYPRFQLSHGMIMTNNDLQPNYKHF